MTPTPLPPVREDVRDCQGIVRRLACFDFPWDMTRSLEFALFRTFASPRVSSLLLQTREFVDRAQRRYDDTDLLVSELLEYGYDSERGTRALRRINQQHGRFPIGNSDFLYVLSTFVFEPIRWNARFGWRRMTQAERLALLHFWREVGRRMGIRDVPGDIAAFERFNLDYERERFAFAESNRAVGGATLAMFAGWFPAFTRPLVRSAMISLMDEPLRKAMGLPRSPAPVRLLVHVSLKLRAAALRVLPKRKRPRLRTELKPRSHPHGYVIEQLGPPPF